MFPESSPRDEERQDNSTGNLLSERTVFDPALAWSSTDEVIASAGRQAGSGDGPSLPAGTIATGSDYSVAGSEKPLRRRGDGDDPTWPGMKAWAARSP